MSREGSCEKEFELVQTDWGESKGSWLYDVVGQYACIKSGLPSWRRQSTPASKSDGDFHGNLSYLGADTDTEVATGAGHEHTCSVTGVTERHAQLTGVEQVYRCLFTLWVLGTYALSTSRLSE